MENNNNLPTELMMHKSWGWTVYVCIDCGWVGSGSPSSYHAIYNPTHRQISDDKVCALLRKGTT